MTETQLDAIPTRLATPADASAIVAVVNAAFAVEKFLEGQRTEQAQILDMMKKGEFLVAWDDSPQMVASVYVELRDDTGYFGMLAVDPARQGTGIGRKMVKAAERYCREHGCKRLDITVLSLRPELPPFYLCDAQSFTVGR